MNNYIFTDNGNHYKRIDKRQARRAYNAGETFYLCVITKWNNKTINAREIAHKSFYINGVFADIRTFFEKIKDNDADFLKIYEKPQYTRLYITKTENYTVKF